MSDAIESLRSDLATACEMVDEMRATISAMIDESRAETSRHRALKTKVREILAQTADDVCWRDAYTDLAALVGMEFDPELLPRERFLGNCAHFYDCLKSGEPYRTPEACEHGVLDGEYCEACNGEYKRAAAEHDAEEDR